VLEVDLHVHSLFSRCGLHTVLELIAAAKNIGLKGFAVTDHGKTMGGRLTSVFFERFRSPEPSVRVFKGIECNVTDSNGTIDIPYDYLPFMDIVLVGIHSNIERGQLREEYTSLLVKALEKNPMIDIVSHPNDPSYPVDYRLLAEAAALCGAALELNNSKVLYSRSPAEEAVAILEACKKTRCRIAVNSDTHAVHELGDDSAVAPLLEKVGFPRELIVNRDAEAAFAFIEERRRFKQM